MFDFNNPHPQVDIMLVNVWTAREWLERNEKNRNIRPDHVNAMVRDLLNDNWKLSTDAIGFSRTGRLLNGQHRLTAVIKAEVPARFIVASGLDDVVQKIMDTGSKRTAADLQKMGGIVTAYHTLSASVVNGVLRYKHSGTGVMRGATEITRMEVSTFTENNAEALALACQQAMRTWNTFRSITSTSLGIAYYLFNEIDPVTAADFFLKLGSGEMLRAGDPIHTLRERAARDRAAGIKITANESLTRLVWTWNAVREGREMRVLRIPERATVLPK